MRFAGEGMLSICKCNHFIWLNKFTQIGNKVIEFPYKNNTNQTKKSCCCVGCKFKRITFHSFATRHVRSLAVLTVVRLFPHQQPRGGFFQFGKLPFQLNCQMTVGQLLPTREPVVSYACTVCMNKWPEIDEMACGGGGWFAGWLVWSTEA